MIVVTRPQPPASAPTMSPHWFDRDHHVDRVAGQAAVLEPPPARSRALVVVAEHPATENDGDDGEAREGGRTTEQHRSQHRTFENDPQNQHQNQPGNGRHR